MARSLNKVELIGNLTRDPELRYTPQGTAVCTFGLATNRQWTTEAGEKREEAEFHRIVTWNKLAEICSQLLTKGRKVYIEGRLQTRSWTGQDGAQRSATEIVASDMIILDPRKEGVGLEVSEEAVAQEPGEASSQAPVEGVEAQEVDVKQKPAKTAEKAERKFAKGKKPAKVEEEKEQEAEEIPF